MAVRTRAAVALLAVLGALAFPATSGAISSAQIVQALNAQRHANGIPGDISENTDWSSKCYLHNRYDGQNATLTHTEDPSNPWYTSGGAWAGANSVLSYGSDWGLGNPFETAPIHLAQLLGPYLAVMGADQSVYQQPYPNTPYVCATTWPGYTRANPGSSQTFTYPGNGSGGVPYQETAAEGPFTPGDMVGLPQPTTTGPYLYLFATGSFGQQNAQLTAASLTGPQGAVEVRTVDNTTSQVGPYLPRPSGMIIPVSPLNPTTTYQASATMKVAGVTLTFAWSFTTAGPPPPPPPPTSSGTGQTPTQQTAPSTQQSSSSSTSESQVSCQTVQVLHTVRYRQRYRDRRGHRRSRWRTKPHLHRQSYRDRRGHRRYRWVRHYIPRQVCS